MKDLKKKEELLNLEPLKIEEEVIYGGFSDVLEYESADNSAFDSDNTKNKKCKNKGCNFGGCKIVD